MDRGIKIAIFVACGLSLGLGLVWNNVIEASRGVVAPQSDDRDGMAATAVSLRVGDTTLPPSRLREEQQALAREAMAGRLGAGDGGAGGGSTDTDGRDAPSAGDAARARQPETEPASGSGGRTWPENVRGFISDDGRYVVQPNDSLWLIAHRRFQFLGLERPETAWGEANPGVNFGAIRPGQKLIIPGTPTRVLPTTPAPSAGASGSSGAGSSAGSGGTYTVRDGDSWWLIAYRRDAAPGKGISDWQAANPGVTTLRPGMELKVPR